MASKAPVPKAVDPDSILCAPWGMVSSRQQALGPMQRLKTMNPTVEIVFSAVNKVILRAQTC